MEQEKQSICAKRRERLPFGEFKQSCRALYRRGDSGDSCYTVGSVKLVKVRSEEGDGLGYVRRQDGCEVR